MDFYMLGYIVPDQVIPPGPSPEPPPTPTPTPEPSENKWLCKISVENDTYLYFKNVQGLDLDFSNSVVAYSSEFNQTLKNNQPYKPNSFLNTSWSNYRKKYLEQNQYQYVKSVYLNWPEDPLYIEDKEVSFYGDEFGFSLNLDIHNNSTIYNALKTAYEQANETVPDKSDVQGLYYDLYVKYNDFIVCQWYSLFNYDLINNIKQYNVNGLWFQYENNQLVNKTGNKGGTGINQIRLSVEIDASVPLTSDEFYYDREWYESVFGEN